MARVLGAAAMLALATPAHGEPVDIVSRPIVLDAGELDARLVTEIAIGRDLGVPTSVAPDAWYGVTSRWTIGITHSHASIALVDAGASLCVHHDDLACSGVYRGSQLDVRWSWRDGDLAVAPRGRLLVRDIDPWKPAIAIGATLRWHAGRFAISGDPYLRFGLAHRDDGNRDAIVLPVWLGVQPACGWLLALHTGFDGELATLRDGWHVPIAFGASARVTGHVEAGIEAGWASLLGPQNDFRRRAVLLTVGWRG